MAGRVMRSVAPSACDPRPAVLDGYAWLVNDRGVATIESLAGHCVHGVVWVVAASEFDALVDGAARRDVVVEVASDRVNAVTGIDLRHEPGPPPVGYLEAVIDGAQEHALADDWITELRRWDRARWAAFDAGRIQDGGPRSLVELLAVPGVVEEVELRSRFGFLAIHGGHLEAMTDVIARRAAEASGASYYGVVHPPGYRHHLASTRYDPAESPALAAFVDHVDIVISVHGYGRRGRWTQLLAGGSHRELAAHVAGHVHAALPGYDVIVDLDEIPPELRGRHPSNPVNRPRRGGVQLELPPRVRGTSPRSPAAGPDGISTIVHDLVAALAAAARMWRDA